MRPPRFALPIAQVPSFDARVGGAGLHAAAEIKTLQINIGLVCNLACAHCHVESSPRRDGDHENMNGQTVDRILDWLRAHPGIRTVDLTGGSPEMNPHFRRLVTECRRMDRHVMDRCNPTIFSYRGNQNQFDFGWVPAFLAEQQVEVVASLPCYLEENVRKQRGYHAFEDSVKGLQQLNEVGYGSNPELKLNLVYNPTGASLPPPQASLAADYRRELKTRHGIVFNELWTITNMPIKRWRDSLQRSGKLEAYMDRLVDAFNPATVEGLMCRHAIHINSQGQIYDCDFNHALNLPVPKHAGTRLWDVTLDELHQRKIATGEHCYGCTAGSGSSCGGALVES